MAYLKPAKIQKIDYVKQEMDKEKSKKNITEELNGWIINLRKRLNFFRGFILLDFRTTAFEIDFTQKEWSIILHISGTTNLWFCVDPFIIEEQLSLHSLASFDGLYDALT